jgi:hypothetical protein
VSPVTVESPLALFRDEEQLGWIHFSERGESVEADLFHPEEQARVEELIEAVSFSANAGDMDDAGPPRAVKNQPSLLVRVIKYLREEGYNISGANTAEALLRFPDDWPE